MNVRKKSKAVVMLTGVMTLCLIFGAAFMGVYPAAAAQPDSTKEHRSSLPEAGDTKDSNGQTPIALQANGKFAFQSILFDELDAMEKELEKLDAMEEELEKLDAMEKELEKLDAMEEELEKLDETAQKQEYLEHGIVSDQNLKTFYYESQLVHIFLDIRKEKSFYFLQVNPQGTVNVKVTRDENNHIESVDYMTDAEVTALFGDMKEEENDEYEASAYDMPQIISVNEQRIAAGAKRWFGDYGLRSGDRIRYDIEAETGDAIMVGFVNNADSRFSDTTYCSALVHREDGVLKCTADFVCGEPVKDGQYKLYIYAPEGALGNVKGSVSIAHAQ